MRQCGYLNCNRKNRDINLSTTSDFKIPIFVLLFSRVSVAISTVTEKTGYQLVNNIWFQDLYLCFVVLTCQCGYLNCNRKNRISTCQQRLISRSLSLFCCSHVSVWLSQLQQKEQDINLSTTSDVKIPIFVLLFSRVSVAISTVTERTGISTCQQHLISKSLSLFCCSHASVWLSQL